MAIDLDHTIVPARNRDASARQLAEILGVPWGPASVGPFAEVYVNGGTTLDFQQTDEPFPIYDNQVGSYGQVYRTEPEGHMREIVQVSYARKAPR